MILRLLRPPLLLGALLVPLVLHAAEPDSAAADRRRADATVVLDEFALRNLRIETVPVERRPFEETIFALGRIRVAPDHRAIVSSRIAGRALRVSAHIDTRIEEGAEVAVIESRLPGDPPPTVTLRAPISGWVRTLALVPGQPVSPEDVLAEIVDLDEVHAAAAVPEHLSGKLRVGQRARLRVPAAPDQEFEAVLAHAGAEADVASGTLEAAFHVHNQGLRLRPGMRAEFSIIVDARPEVLSVPRSALQGGLGDRFVFVRDSELTNAFRRTPVVVGADNDRFVEILEGVEPGQHVVSRGGYSLGFAGRGSLSLREALDAAHGHAHAEDGSELPGTDHDHNHDHGEDHDHPHEHADDQDHDHAAGTSGSDRDGWGAPFWARFFGATSAVLLVLLILATRRPRAATASTDLGGRDRA